MISGMMITSQQRAGWEVQILRILLHTAMITTDTWTNISSSLIFFLTFLLQQDNSKDDDDDDDDDDDSANGTNYS